MNTVYKLQYTCKNPNRLLRLGLILLIACGNVFAGDVKLAWNASTSPGVGGYKLFIGPSSKNYTSSVDLGNVTAYTATGLTNGATYFFALKTYNAAKSIESSFSNEVSAAVSATTTVTASFTPSVTTGTAPLIVSFTPSTTGTISSYKWDLGNGVTSTASNPQTTYSTAGTFTAKLTVNEGTTSSATTSKTITVNPAVVVPPPPPPSNTTGGTTGSLVAAYSFEEFSGNVVADASGNGNHGVVTEATSSSSGKYGRARKFDGVNDWITVNDSASLDLTSGVTLEAWVQPSVKMNWWRTLIMKEQPGNEVYALYANSGSNKPAGAIWVNKFLSVVGGSLLAPNVWVHIAETYDGKNQCIYIDGVQKACNAQTGLLKVSNGALRIGGNSIYGEYFNGLIDEIRIYNRALTSTEISSDFKTAISVSNPSKMVIGNNTLESKLDSNPSGQAEAFKTTPQKASALQALQVYLDSSATASELVAGVYADNGGHPGKLLTQGKLTSPQAGKTNTVPIDSVNLAANTTYWIAILAPSGKGQNKFRIRGAANNPLETSASTTLTSLPSQWSTGTVYPSDGPMSVYGTGY